MVLILVGAKAIRFSVNTALERQQLNFYSYLNCIERLQARTNWKADAKYGRSYIHSSI